MAGTNQIPERLINFRCYRDGTGLLGVATVTLPQFQAMTDTVSGAGIAGEVETPVLGHYSSITATVSFRTITADVSTLAAQMAHPLDFRGSQQIYDASTGKFVTQAVKLTLRGVPKNVNLGNLEVGATTGTEVELECTYVKLDVGGKTVVEIDKYNYIARFGDEDALTSVRKDLGLA